MTKLTQTKLPQTLMRRVANLAHQSHLLFQLYCGSHSPYTTFQGRDRARNHPNQRDARTRHRSIVPLSRPSSPFSSHLSSTLQPLILAGLLGGSLLSITAPVSAQQTVPSLLTVYGQGVITIPATIAQVSLGVQVYGGTAAEVQAEAAQRSSEIMQFLRSRQVDKLQTTGVQLSPIYETIDGRSQVTRYQAINTVRFEVPTDKAGEIIDQSVQYGATRIDGLTFTGTDAAIAAARDQALEAATQDARHQADVVLASLGLRAESIYQINIGYSSPMPSTPIYNQALEFASSGIADRTAIEGGEQSIQANVTLQIRY